MDPVRTYVRIQFTLQDSVVGLAFLSDPVNNKSIHFCVQFAIASQPRTGSKQFLNEDERKVRCIIVSENSEK